MTNHYETLGVDRKATLEEIKKAYKTLAKKWHPDRNNGLETDTFKKINEAYNVLSNEKKREEYDNEMLFGFSFGFKSFYPEEVNPFKKTSMDLNAEDDEKLSKMFAKLRKEKA
jgi:chaperone dnaJ